MSIRKISDLKEKVFVMKQKFMCSKGEHKWNHCKCLYCEAKRDTGHVWDGCKCTVCGEVKDEGHEWKGCTCIVCGAIRNEGHEWDCCYCKVCGETRKIEDGLEYYSDKPDCPDCDYKAGTPEELFESVQFSIDDVYTPKEKSSICPLTVIRCLKCNRIVISSNQTTCSLRYKGKT